MRFVTLLFPEIITRQQRKIDEETPEKLLPRWKKTITSDTEADKTSEPNATITQAPKCLNFIHRHRGRRITLLGLVCPIPIRFGKVENRIPSNAMEGYAIRCAVVCDLDEMEIRGHSPFRFSRNFERNRNIHKKNARQ
jgi:hypothetical protein